MYPTFERVFAAIHWRVNYWSLSRNQKQSSDFVDHKIGKKKKISTAVIRAEKRISVNGESTTVRGECSKYTLKSTSRKQTNILFVKFEMFHSKAPVHPYNFEMIRIIFRTVHSDHVKTPQNGRAE
ncbi:hypothetical protein Tsp_11222 [Trichinella spiralis]|uniref:hypothetical protein n=1 Tax=Trichinella spiralis TaxID=6334 RepID=UPI0001EFD18A|nr:hypothetical protein Tsp_11222 [Trichinella spiralis]